MSINTVKTEIQKMREDWEVIRDFKAGEKAVKAKGKKYLPAINSDMKAKEEYYNAYKERGEVKPVTKKAIEANIGLILSKEPMIPEYPAPVNYIVDDITNDGVDLYEFITALTDEVCTTQFCGVLVDHSESPSNEYTYAQKKELNLRAFAKLYPAESIVNFGVGKNGKLRFVVLQEDYEDYADDDIDKLFPEIKQQYRLLIIRNGIYYNEVYRENGKKEFKKEKTVTPRKNGSLFNYIPFLFLNGIDNTPKVPQPRMLAVAYLNWHDFQDHVDYKWLLHNCAAITIWASGVNKNDDLSKIGPGVVWKFTSPEAKAGVLESSGNAFPSMENNLKSNVEKMASMTLDSMNLEKGNETATRERYERTGKTVSVKQIARSLQTGINKVIEWIFDWENIKWDYKYEIQFHTDYVEVALDPQELQALVMAYIQNTISLQDLFFNLQKGGKIRPEKTFEEHKEEILMQGGNTDNDYDDEKPEDKENEII